MGSRRRCNDIRKNLCRPLIHVTFIELLARTTGFQLSRYATCRERRVCIPEDLDASFIESGAFRFRLTNRIGQHLTVDSDNNIYLYKNAEKLTVRAAGDVDFTDHPLSLEIYDAPEPRTWHNFFSSRDSSTRDKVRVLEAMGFIASLGLLASIVQIGLGVAQLRVAYRQLDQAP